MKLSLLKQTLIEKNTMSEEQIIMCNIREEYRNKKDSNISIVDKAESVVIEKETKDVFSYNKSNGLSGLDDTKLDTMLQASYTTTSINSKNVDSIKIIGITGSRGKSTTAFLVHKYLEDLGYKSILYSSIQVKSPASYINSSEPCEIPLQDENNLLSIIEEAEAYGADYIVLEINETTIEKGLVQGIPFNIRALTNINPLHNDEQYSKEEYVRIKKSFFENIPEDEDCTCVLGLTGGFTREEFNSLLRLNSHPKITYGTKYLCELRNADYTNLDCMLYFMESSIEGLDLKVRVKDKSYNFKTNILLPHNSLNIICAIAILEGLNIYNPEIFNNSIRNVNIPGREEVIKVKDRTIVIGLSIMPSLEIFKTFKGNDSNIKKIKVLTAGIGTGFVSWDKVFSSELYLNKRKSARQYCMNYIGKNADFAYITSNDNAAENPLSIAQEMQGYLNNSIPSTIVVNRQEAIRKAIIESEPFDLIYISGRGNRRIFCDTANTVKLFKDREVVEKVLKELRW